MKHVWVEKTKAEELVQAFDWLKKLCSRNLIDWGVLTYPATVLLKVHNGIRNLLHVPVQTCYVVESLGISPENSATDTASALSAVFQVIHWESINKGQKEVYFLCSDEQTCAFAEHHGMERMNIPLYRWKLSEVKDEQPVEN